VRQACSIVVVAFVPAGDIVTISFVHTKLVLLVCSWVAYKCLLIPSYHVLLIFCNATMFCLYQEFPPGKLQAISRLSKQQRTRQSLIGRCCRYLL
jgi:hypothetical protein